MMMNELEKGRVALVTGGSRGIGKGIALVLADAGYDIAITYTSKQELAVEVPAKVVAQIKKCKAVLDVKVVKL